MGAVPSTLHVNVKFHTDHGIATVKGSQQVARQCLVATVNQDIKQKELVREVPLQQLQEPHEGNGGSCAEDLVRVKILSDEDRSFQIGVGMTDKDKVEMLLFLIQNVDVFAQSPYEVPGVDPEFIVHKLNVDPLLTPHFATCI